MLERVLGDGCFGVSFFPSSQRQETCGSNGLPLTPNSIRILGRSQLLKSISHPNLAQYVDILRGKHERIIIVSEYYTTSLESIVKNKTIDFKTDVSKLLIVVEGILEGLTFLNSQGLLCSTLSLSTILSSSPTPSSSSSIKIFSWGLHYQTQGGEWVAFPLGSASYTPPDLFSIARIGSVKSNRSSNSKEIGCVKSMGRSEEGGVNSKEIGGFKSMGSSGSSEEGGISIKEIGSVKSMGRSEEGGVNTKEIGSVKSMVNNGSGGGGGINMGGIGCVKSIGSVGRSGEYFGVDSWGVGIVLLELVLGRRLWGEKGDLAERVERLCRSGEKVLEFILEEHGASEILQELDQSIVSLIRKCLIVNPALRPWPSHLLAYLNSIVAQNSNFTHKNESINESLQLSKFGLNIKSQFFHSFALGDRSIKNELRGKKINANSYDHLGQRGLREVYHFWQLAGGDVIGELKKQGLTRKKPPILSLLKSMRLGGETVGKTKEKGFLLDNTVIILPLNELRKRLSTLSPYAYYPLISQISSNSNSVLNTSDKIENDEAASLPLIIREKDIEYQFKRILLFDRLLKGYPYTKERIYAECLVDIPPFFRSQIWACLLGITGDVITKFESIDKETPTSTDRQIEVDIPRCHQYDELLSSPSGHAKFKRVLKAWVVSNSGKYVYWQGLDSLSAPFLYLNFNNEAMAFSCLSAFIPKYLHDFFLKDNSAVIQEYLAKFSQLIAFHDPILTNHLDSIGFIPELYAIPWFLTMFSHVFPLHKIFHLWDKLLLGDSSFSLCIGLSILIQLREGLLSSGFNECILLFSDMPEINIEECVRESVVIYSSVPKSVLCRSHEPPISSCLPPPILKNLGSSHSTHSISQNYRTSSLLISSNEALKMEGISLVELKKERVPRISGEDVLQLLSMSHYSPPSKSQKSTSILVIDVRSREDYNRGAIPGSLNMPFSTAFTPDGKLSNCDEVGILNSHSSAGILISIVGNRGDSAIKFAEKLLKLNYGRLTVIHKGIDIFRSGHVLVVPSTIVP